jgi:hypothetical protein
MSPIETKRTGQLPNAGKHVLVQCDGYRCLAYRSSEGAWRSVYGNEELKTVIEVVPFGPAEEFQSTAQ